MNNGYTPWGATGTYTLEDGVSICKMIEPWCSIHGFHVALTGGCLYGEGGRKDIDLIFYRIREVLSPNMVAFNQAMEDKCDMVLQIDHGFVKKYLIGGVVPIDAMFPEDWAGTYDTLDHLKIDKPIPVPKKTEVK